MSLPGPLRLSPVCLAKVWAAPRPPAPWAGLVACPPLTGEVWLLSDRHHVTPVADGPLAGQGLDQVLAQWPEWMLGPGRPAGLPILTKLLNVGDWLSVQVHPDDATARRLENEPWGKSECWLVLDGQPGAEIVLGLKPGCDRAGLEAALAAGEIAAVLARVPARSGEAFHLPAGVVHATGPGLFIFELQQMSDVTYRFYDWDRLGDDGRPRPLHQQKALAALIPSGPGAPVPPRALPHPTARVELLVEDPHFALTRIATRAAYRPQGDQPRLRHWFVLSGQGHLLAPGAEPRAVVPGQSWLLPAGLDGVELISEAGQELTLLESLAPGGAGV